ATPCPALSVFRRRKQISRTRNRRAGLDGRRCGAALGQPPDWGHTGNVRLKVWVRPGSARPGVGGEHDGALVVRVSARAVDGRATAAALAAIADAFGVRRHAVTLVAGPASRMKIVDVAGGGPAVLDRLRAPEPRAPLATAPGRA